MPPPPSKPPVTATAPTKPVTPPSTKPAPGRPVGKAAAVRTPKTFAIGTYDPSVEGKKVIIYGRTGGGKTTLATTAPNPVFIAFDDGVRLIKNPLTGEPIRAIPGITSLNDVRDALHQKNLFNPGDTIVIDTMTKLEAVSEQYIFDNYPAKAGRATNMRAYGWDGPAHQLDVMRLILTDLDAHVRLGVNTALLCQQGQIRIPNSEGADYLEDGPKLSHNNQSSCRMELCEWADHVLRIGYLNFEVKSDSDKAGKAGKVVGDQTRAIFSGGASHFVAKSRPIDGKKLPAIISFDTEADDSLWQMIFKGAIPDAE